MMGCRVAIAVESLRSNAGRQARLEAGAQRTLEGVACRPMLGPVSAHDTRTAAFLLLDQYSLTTMAPSIGVFM
jgi:hypothetical protein